MTNFIRKPFHMPNLALWHEPAIACFQDTSGLVDASGADNAIRLMQDLSISNYNVSAPDDSSRPILKRPAGQRPSIFCNGAQYLAGTNTTLFGQATSWSMFGWMNRTGDAATQLLASKHNSTPSQSQWIAGWSSTGFPFMLGIQATSGSSIQIFGPAVAINTWCALEWGYKLETSTIYLRVDGGEPVEEVLAGGMNTVAGTQRQIRLGGRSGASPLFLSGSFIPPIGVNGRNFTADERAWLLTRGPVL